MSWMFTIRPSSWIGLSGPPVGIGPANAAAGQPGRRELVRLVACSRGRACSRTSARPGEQREPVDGVDHVASTRFSTTSGRCSGCLTACELTPMPSIAVLPTHQADDIGPGSWCRPGCSELISTTGVPKYSILGSVRASRCLRRGVLGLLPRQRAPGPAREVTRAGISRRVRSPRLLEVEQRALDLRSADIFSRCSVAAYDPVTRDHHRQRVGRAGGANRAYGPRVAHVCGELRIAESTAVVHIGQMLEDDFAGSRWQGADPP